MLRSWNHSMMFVSFTYWNNLPKRQGLLFQQECYLNDDNKSIDWVDTMFRQLHRKLVRWTTSHTKMLRGMVKIDVKKDVCHFKLVIEVLIINK